ncbi:hypothetical protein Tco_0329038 [Tanacetum coccineum]
MRAEYCLSERKRLKSECEKQADLLKARDAKVESLKAQLLLKETKDVEVARLRAQNSVDGKVTKLQSLISAKDLELKDLNVVVSSLKSQNDGLCCMPREFMSRYERLKEQIEEFQDAHMRIVNDKVAKLDADLLETALHLEEKFYPHLLNTIYAGGSAISRTIKKGMQDGLSADIDHEKADQVVLGETSMSFALSVAHSRVERIRENVAAQRVPTAIVSKTTLSITFAFASSIPPINIDDYEVVSADGQEDAQGNVRESWFPSRSLSLYAPLPNASVTSYGPSHLGPSFPTSSARLASLLRYTRSPGLKVVAAVFDVVVFFPSFALAFLWVTR